MERTTGWLLDRFCWRSTSSLSLSNSSASQFSKMLPFDGQSVPIQNRRVLRYGPHGLHEYRGKYFPQLVRSLLNISESEEGATVFDPMIGSGTTAVEAILLGNNVIGFDLNPLSVLISNTKCRVLSLTPDELAKHYEELDAEIEHLVESAADGETPWLERLPPENQIYLGRWFSERKLAELDALMVRIQAVKNKALRSFFALCLSDTLRKVSWQKDDDLRARRQVMPESETDTAELFRRSLRSKTGALLSFLYQRGDRPVGKFDVSVGDARDSRKLLSRMRGKIDVVITSPPYATALPYLDTDRLSLYFLGLLSRPEHRRLDLDMVGNREITNGQRNQLWEDYVDSEGLLPDPIHDLIDEIDELNREAEVGFRRKNLAALLSKYFLDMRSVMQGIYGILEAGRPAFLVVGNNHTRAGDSKKLIAINTHELLGVLGESVGFSLERSIPMEMLRSRDLFRRNSGTEESILCFRKPE